MNNPKQILKVKDLEVKFGDGCVYCLNGGDLDKGHCPHCHTVWALNKVSLICMKGRYWEL